MKREERIKRKRSVNAAETHRTICQIIKVTDVRKQSKRTSKPYVCVFKMFVHPSVDVILYYILVIALLFFFFFFFLFHFAISANFSHIFAAQFREKSNKYAQIPRRIKSRNEIKYTKMIERTSKRNGINTKHL